MEPRTMHTAPVTRPRYMLPERLRSRIHTGHEPSDLETPIIGRTTVREIVESVPARRFAPVALPARLPDFTPANDDHRQRTPLGVFVLQGLGVLAFFALAALVLIVCAP